MASIIDSERLRGKAAASQTTGSGGGGADDIQKRLSLIEATLAEIKAFLLGTATRAELAESRGELREVKATLNAILPHLATKEDAAGVKTDIANVKTDIANFQVVVIKWVVGTMIGCAAASYSVARLFG